MIIFKASSPGYDYEYIFDTFEKFTLWTDNWKTVFNMPVEGLMVNTFEEGDNV